MHNRILCGLRGMVSLRWVDQCSALNEGRIDRTQVAERGEAKASVRGAGKRGLGSCHALPTAKHTAWGEQGSTLFSEATTGQHESLDVLIMPRCTD